MSHDQIPSPEERSMNEVETIAFLAERGIAPLRVKDWQPHQSVLYVFEEMIRGDDGPFAGRFPDKRMRPSIARVHDPIKIGLVRDGGMPGRVIHDIYNMGTLVDLYAIDPVTRQPVWVDKEDKTKLYQVVPGNIFAAADTLFIPSKE